MAETQPMFEALCYTAPEFRNQLANLVCEEGVSDLMDGSLLVTTGGSGLTLDVAQGGGFVSSDVDDQGMYSIYNDDTVVLTATTADGTNPRIDQVVATVRDSQFGGVDNDWVLSVLAGTPTGGATLSNLTGAAALPDRTIRLAYVLVPATFTGPFVNATHILDARTAYVSCGNGPFPYVSLEPAAVTSIPNTAAYTQPTLGTTLHLDDEYFSVSGATVTVKTAGTYDIQAANQTAADGGGARGALLLLNNTNLPNASPDGTIVDRDFKPTSSASVVTTLHGARTGVVLAAGTTIKFALNVSGAGGALNSAGSGSVAHLTVRKVN